MINFPGRPALGRLKRGLQRRLGLGSDLPAPSGRPGGPVAALDLHECQTFFGYLRIQAFAAVADAEKFTDAELLAGVRVAIEIAGVRPMHHSRVVSVQPSRVVEFVIEALVSSDFPMDQTDILVWFGEGLSRFHMRAVLPYARARDLRTHLTTFNTMIEQFAQTEGRRPKLLDVGGRARSSWQKSAEYPHCDVTVFDIIADEGVDVVGDAHELSRHFPPESFDFVMSVAVFEHLLMPWKAAVEVNRVLRPGGVVYLWAPQTEAVHDVPWDFFRFSDAAWLALFNRHTGYEVVVTDMSLAVHMVPRVYPEYPVYAERKVGFMCSEVVARKIGPPLVDWPVPMRDVIDTHYPLDPHDTPKPRGSSDTQNG